MSKSKTIKERFELVTLSSGIEVQVYPFPANMYNQVMAKGLDDFPDPDPPKKIVKTFDGEEETDDLDNLEYLAAKRAAQNNRTSLLAKAVFDLCVQLEMEVWEPTIKRLEKYSTGFPEDPDDRRVAFLERYAVRTKDDYQLLMIAATEPVMVSDKEVEQRLKMFQSNVARATATQAETSGPDEGQRLALDGATEGA